MTSRRGILKRAAAWTGIVAVYAIGFGICHGHLAPVEKLSIPRYGDQRIAEQDELLRLVAVTSPVDSSWRIWDVDSGSDLYVKREKHDRLWLTKGEAFRYEAARERIVRFDPHTGAITAETPARLGGDEHWAWLQRHPRGALMFNEAAGGVTFWDPETGERETLFAEMVVGFGQLSPTGRFMHLTPTRNPAPADAAAAPSAPTATVLAPFNPDERLKADEGDGPKHLLADVTAKRIVGEFFQGLNDIPLRFAPDESFAVGPSPRRKDDRLHGGIMLAVRELPSLKILRRFEGNYCHGVDTQNRVMIGAPEGLERWRLDGESPEVFERSFHLPKAYPDLPGTQYQRATRYRDDDGAPLLTFWTMDWLSFFQFPAWASKAQIWLRKSPVGEIHVGIVRRQDREGRTESEYVFLYSDERDPRGPQHHIDSARDASRVAITGRPNGPIAVYDLPFRKRWLAIATYPLVGVMAAVGIWGLARIVWRSALALLKPKAC